MARATPPGGGGGDGINRYGGDTPSATLPLDSVRRLNLSDGQGESPLASQLQSTSLLAITDGQPSSGRQDTPWGGISPAGPSSASLVGTAQHSMASLTGGPAMGRLNRGSVNGNTAMGMGAASQEAVPASPPVVGLGRWRRIVGSMEQVKSGQPGGVGGSMSMSSVVTNALSNQLVGARNVGTRSGGLSNTALPLTGTAGSPKTPQVAVGRNFQTGIVDNVQLNDVVGHEDPSATCDGHNVILQPVDVDVSADEGASSDAGTDIMNLGVQSSSVLGDTIETNASEATPSMKTLDLDLAEAMMSDEDGPIRGSPKGSLPVPTSWRQLWDTPNAIGSVTHNQPVPEGGDPESIEQARLEGLEARLRASTRKKKMSGNKKVKLKPEDMAKIVFATGSSFRVFCLRMVTHKLFGGVILSSILLNTVLITLQTTRFIEVAAGWYLAILDNVFLGIYLFEIVVKLYVYRRAFWQSGWNVFDFVVVMSSLVDFLKFVVSFLSTFNSDVFLVFRVFRALRAVRALRVLRTIAFFEHLQEIVLTLVQSIPAIANIVMLLFMVLYMFAVIGVNLFSDVLPARFGGIFVSIFTLFQLITLDDWFEVYLGVRDSTPSSIVYFVVFIIMETFIFINFFIAVIVNNLQTSKVAQKKKIEEKQDRRAAAAKRRQRNLAQGNRRRRLRARKRKRRESQKRRKKGSISEDTDSWRFGSGRRGRKASRKARSGSTGSDSSGERVSSHGDKGSASDGSRRESDTSSCHDEGSVDVDSARASQGAKLWARGALLAQVHGRQDGPGRIASLASNITKSIARSRQRGNRYNIENVAEMMGVVDIFGDEGREMQQTNRIPGGLNSTGTTSVRTTASHNSGETSGSGHSSHRRLLNAGNGAPRGIFHFYGNVNEPTLVQHAMEQIFMLMASIDSHYEQYTSQEQIIDELLYLCELRERDAEFA